VLHVAAVRVARVVGVGFGSLADLVAVVGRKVSAQIGAAVVVVALALAEAAAGSVAAVVVAAADSVVVVAAAAAEPAVVEPAVVVELELEPGAEIIFQKRKVVSTFKTYRQPSSALSLCGLLPQQAQLVLPFMSQREVLGVAQVFFRLHPTQFLRAKLRQLVELVVGLVNARRLALICLECF
jgi:hypothetical protein